jgi:hypothetical protein
MRELCDEMIIERGTDGTTVRMRRRLGDVAGKLEPARR